jgi:rhodanese-related sulfurtransferase
MEDLKIKEVCPTSTLELVKRNYLLLDIREDEAFKQFSFYVPRVLHIPESELVQRMEEIPRNEKVIVASLTGEASLSVVRMLNEFGFTNLLNMKKGLQKWVQKGYPIKGETTIERNTSCGGNNCK